jgi:hypothetical protein
MTQARGGSSPGTPFTDLTGILTDEHRERIAAMEIAGVPESVIAQARAGIEVGERSAIDERLAQYEALRVEEAVRGTAVTTQRTQLEQQLVAMMGDFNRDVVPRDVSDCGGTGNLFFRPGQATLPYPERANGTERIHFHVEGEFGEEGSLAGAGEPDWPDAGDVGAAPVQ